MIDDELLALRDGVVGRLRLNRPRALHTLTLEMCRAMTEALLAWRDDPAVEAVLLDHAAGRGFCAGGDVLRIATSAQGHGGAARAFFFQEYRLNHLLFGYAKPTVALMDGVTMGGGVGVALPCRYRIATERTAFAMPETSIGLFPDVGGGWYLSRLPGRMPQFLALTGAKLDGAECAALGLATHYLASDTLDGVKARIAAAPKRIEDILAAAAAAPPPAAIKADRERIDRLFAAERLEDILAALAADPSDWAARQLAILRTKSPVACKVALRLLAEGARLRDFADEMRLEYGLVCHIYRRHDFVEGVRALLIDKDNAPRWQPPTAEDVTNAMIDAVFEPLPARETWTPLPEEDRPDGL